MYVNGMNSLLGGDAINYGKVNAPSLVELTRGNSALNARASDALYGNVGANLDARDWSKIMSSSNPLAAAEQGLRDMYSDPAYQVANLAYLMRQGYPWESADLTYQQMAVRIGSRYTPGWYNSAEAQEIIRSITAAQPAQVEQIVVEAVTDYSPIFAKAEAQEQAAAAAQAAYVESLKPFYAENEYQKLLEIEQKRQSDIQAAEAEAARLAAIQREALTAEAERMRQIAERERIAVEAERAKQAAAAAQKAAQDAAAAAAKVIADAAIATAAADAARAKAELDMKYAFFDPSIKNKSALEKAQYFNFLKSQGKSESLIFEAIAYWIGPQTPEAIAALKTMADELLKPKPIVSPKPPETPISTPTTPAAAGGNTGLVIAAALAALTLLG